MRRTRAGTTIAVRDLFFNVPARRKFLRSEATESFHLTNLVTHYALAHPEIAFTLTNNGREVLRAAAAARICASGRIRFSARTFSITYSKSMAATLRLRASLASFPRRATGALRAIHNICLLIGRFVSDRLIGRALSEGYRAILPHGVYPAALLFIETPLEEVDVNVHPAKTEVRFRRAAAVADAVREAVRAGLASAGYVEARRRMSIKDPDESG